MHNHTFSITLRNDLVALLLVDIIRLLFTVDPHMLEIRQLRSAYRTKVTEQSIKSFVIRTHSIGQQRQMRD